MKLYTIYADMHVFSKYLAINGVPTFKKMIENQNAYFIGDLVDAKNCEPNLVGSMKAFYEHMQREAFGRILLGNHDGGFEGVDDIILPGGILLTHGDRIMWTKEKCDKFRAEKMGQGSGWIQKLIQYHNGSISAKEARLAASYARSRKCTTVVFGHIHPKNRFDKIVDGIRVICVQRGRSEIYL